MQIISPSGREISQDWQPLPAKKVVHIVGPIVTGRLTKGQEQNLADCYRNTLDQYPGTNERARTASSSSPRTAHEMERVIFNVFKEEDKQYYEKELL